MKRLLSFILALSLIGSLALPALAEGTEDFVACTVTDGCTMEAGHDGECSVPEPKVCQTGCTLEAGHDGECSVPEPKVCQTGCTLEAGHDGECSVPEPKVCQTGCTLEAGHDGDCVVPEPKVCQTGCILEAGHDGDCKLQEGDGNGGVLPVEETGNNKSLYVLYGGEYVTWLTVKEGDPALSVQFFYYAPDETPMPLDDSAEFTVIDRSSCEVSSGVVMEKNSENSGLYTIRFSSPGPYSLVCTMGENEIGRIDLNVNSGEPGGEGGGILSDLNVDNPPSDLDGLYLCWLVEDGMRKWGNRISVSGEFSAKVVYVKDGVSTLVEDGDRLSYSPSNGLNRKFGGGVLTIQDGSKAGQYFINYTHTDGTESYVVVNYNGSNTPNLENPPVGPGIYMCWNQNGQMMWTDNVNFSGEFGATLVLVDVVEGKNVASVITDGSKVTVTPSEGLQYTIYSDGICKLKGIRGGSYTMTYTVNETTRYELKVRYDDGTVDLADAPSDPGLYHVIFDNHYIFSRQKGVSMRNGSGQTYGALVLVKENGDKLQLMDPALKDKSAKPYLTVSPSDGMTLDYNDSNKSWIMRPNKADLYTITYADVDGKNYTATMTITNNGQLYASVDGGQTWESTLHVTEDEPTAVEFAWKNAAGNYIKTIGTVNGSNDQLRITRDMNTGISTLVVDNPNVNANASYHYDDYNTYMMQIISHEAYRLALVADGTQTPVFDYIGEVGSEIPVQILFGQPSYGLDPFGGALTVSAGLQLEDNNATGVYKMKIIEEGKHTISFTHTCTADCSTACDIAGKTFAINVQGVPKGSGGGFFALVNNSSSPTFSSGLIAGETQTMRLCYGSFGNYTVLTAAQLQVRGDAVTIEQNGDAIDVVFNKNGQSLIQYVDGDDIIHNYVVKCYSGLAEMGMAYYSEQGYNTVNLSYNGKTVTVGPALRTEEKMWMWPGNSFNHSADEDWDIHDEVVIGAMYAGEGHSVTEPLDASFYNRISNMNMSLLYCQNTVPNPDGGNNVTIEAPTTVTWKGRNLQMQKFQGKKGLYFESDLLISFDIQLDEGKYRFYRPADLSYRAVPDDKITVDITDADVLNTLLSNSYTLINYLEDNVAGFKYGGGNLTLILPAVTYDKILVSQLILPGSSDVLGVFSIRGSDEGTTVPGIYSKGFLHRVENLNFVANSNATMSFGGETFTCGLLVNNTRTDFQPTFDLDTLKAYHPEFQGLSDADAQAKFAEYNPSVSTNGNSYNIGDIVNCTFTGYEYAMRTDKGGFVQGAHGCTIKHCKYGVYINAGGVDTLHTDGRANTIWRDNRFIENWVGVRITGLPKDLSPYYIRFIDNRFFRNGTDFGVTCPGRFYFYRNYYTGRYPFSGWGVSAASEVGADAEGARAANLSVSDGAVLVTNPCRSMPDSTENLWIFDTDDLQNTMILQSEADGLLVDPDAIVDLGETLDIPVLNDKEDPVGVWTIYEGGAAE